MVWFALAAYGFFNRSPGPGDADSPDLESFRAAREFLERRLANGPVPQQVVLDEAQAAGLSTLNLYEAMAHLDVKHRASDDSWRLEPR